MYIYARTERPPPPDQNLPLYLTLLATLGAIGGFCWVKQDYVAATALATIMVCGLSGYYVGALRLMAYFTSLAACYAFTWPVTHFVQPYIGELFGSPGMSRLVSLLASASGIFALTSLTLSYISRRLLRDRPQATWANRVFGFGVGSLQGTAAMLVVLSGIQVTEPYANRRIQASNQQDAQSVARSLSKRVVEIANSTRRSAVGFLVTNYNPFERVPQLRNLQRTASMVSDPYRLEKVMRSPAVKRLKNNPDVRGAIESLAQDPDMRKLAETGQLLDQKTALALLNNPRVAKLLEQPDLIMHFTEAMSEIDSLSMR